MTIKTIPHRLGAITISDEPPTQMRLNAEKDPSYSPYCLRCTKLVRMSIVKRYLWECGICGAVHDERLPAEVAE